MQTKFGVNHSTHNQIRKLKAPEQEWTLSVRRIIQNRNGWLNLDGNVQSDTITLPGQRRDFSPSFEKVHGAIANAIF